METGILTAMGMLLAAVSTWSWKVTSAMLKRIATLEASVKSCHDGRLEDQKLIGSLGARLDAAEDKLKTRGPK